MTAGSDTQPRRTFAVISHPDAGKSTLTEALALHARLVSEAGAVHGKAGRRGTISDWMAMELTRGISVSSTALRFEYDGHVLNLVDTPGHADFSEDTYRALSAVDLAVMLVDAGKGLEPQTLKLFRVCRRFGLPVVTVINKWDRPGQDPLALLDAVRDQIGMVPTPVTWPIGEAERFAGVHDRMTGRVHLYARTAGGATRAPERVVGSDEVPSELADVWRESLEGSALLDAEGLCHDPEGFLAGRTTPVVFISALLNFGVGHLLDLLTSHAPGPRPRQGVDGAARPLLSPFSAQVFKVQSGMDPAHRDRMAFARICSGRFERGVQVVNARTGRLLTTKHSQTVQGRERQGVEEAYPGDVVGLVNAGDLIVGDSLYVDEPVTFPAVPRFEPEHFVVARPRDVSKHKQFRSAMRSLDEEGAVQVLHADEHGDQAPVLAAVGPMQFEVVLERARSEYRCEVHLEPLPYTIARPVTDGDATPLAGEGGVRVMRRTDGQLLALVTDRWRLLALARRYPGLAQDEPVSYETTLT